MAVGLVHAREAVTFCLHRPRSSADRAAAFEAVGESSILSGVAALVLRYPPAVLFARC